MTVSSPDLFTLYLMGTAVQEMREETKRDIGTLIVEGENATRLLVETLEHLRAPAARDLRGRVLAHLNTSKMAAIVRKPVSPAEGGGTK